MKSMSVDGQDVQAVYDAAKAALDTPRSGKGPSLPRRRDVPAHRPLRRRSAGLPREGRVPRDPRHAGSDRAPPDEARHLRRRLRGARPRGHRHRRRLRRVRKERHRPGARRRAEEASMPELSYREAVRDALVDRDAPGRRRLHHGRGHRRDGRLDGRHARDARRVRQGARPQHADLRDGARRRGDRRRDAGHAPGRARSCTRTS